MGQVLFIQERTKPSFSPVVGPSILDIKLT
nr:MAG TPA: hypothetical protein [Caudoviricetes sp.]